jgi:hypothetical protein
MGTPSVGSNDVNKAIPSISCKSLLGIQNLNDSHIDTLSLDYFFRISTSESRSPSMLMSRDIPAENFAGLLKRTGLMPLQLTRAEATRVEETPGIGRAAFSKLFGGNFKKEWPACSRIPGYSDFLCADAIVQPFAPHAAGKPGLLLRLPTVIETPETEKHTIHVLSNTLQGDALYYRGKYTRVPAPEIHFHWKDQTSEVRILKLCYTSDKGL